MGFADGGCAGRLAAARHPLRILCRALRVGNDRSRERVGAGPRASLSKSDSVRESALSDLILRSAHLARVSKDGSLHSLWRSFETHRFRDAPQDEVSKNKKE